MSENLRNFVASVYGFDAVVRRTSGDQWDAPSACEGWSGRDLLQHQCAVLNGVAEIARTGAMARPTPPEDMSNPQAVWDQCRSELLEALDQEGALKQEGPYWFDAATVDDLIGFVAWDPMGHSWDLAQCSSGDAAMNEAVCETLLARVQAVQPMLEESGRTGPMVEVPDDAPASKRFLGVIGRQA